MSEQLLAEADSTEPDQSAPKTNHIKVCTLCLGTAHHFCPCIRINTVIILNIGTDRSEQTVQTQIRLLLMEQSDQGLLCLLFCIFLTQYCTVKSNCSKCRTVMVIISGVPIFRIFTVHI